MEPDGTRATRAYRSRPVYVVGGPIAIGASGVAVRGVPDWSPPAPGAPRGAGGPPYIEYLGFDPRQQPHDSRPPSYGVLSPLLLRQPKGTTCTWTLDPGLVVVGDGIGAWGVLVGATGPSSRWLGARCRYRFDNGDPKDHIRGECLDDSDATLALDGRPQPERYRFAVYDARGL